MIILDNQKGIGAFERWTDEEKKTLHQASLRILAEIGVRVFNEEALELLKNNGAQVEGNLVKIPKTLVEKALQSAPESYSIYDTDGNEALRLLPNHVYFGTGTDMPEFKDLYTGEVRDGTLEDCENAAKIADRCDSIDWVSTYALANDKDPRVADLYHFLAVRKYSRKPNMLLAVDEYSLQGVIDMAAMQAGGYEALREKPTFVHYTEPVSPLENTTESIGKLMLCADYGIPVTYTSGIMAGGTGPVTLAGTLAVGNAECLAGLVIHQLRKPGAPFMYGIEASIMDMKTTMCLYGNPEYGLMNSFVGEMGRFYKLPTFGISGASDSNDFDFQMGAEMIYTMMCATYGRQNLVHDNGYMGLGQFGALQAILAANELLTYVKRYAKGIEFTEDTIDFNSIQEVGPGGNFLARKETFKKFKTEFYAPEFLSRWRYKTWEKNGCPSIKEQLTKKAISIVEGECSVYLRDEQIKAMEQIIDKHEAFYNIK